MAQHIIDDLSARVRRIQQNRSRRTNNHLLPLKRVSPFTDTTESKDSSDSDINISQNNHNNHNHQPQQKRRKIHYPITKNKWSIDPSNSNMSQRREARLKYRQLAQHTLENRDNIINPLNSYFIDTLHKQQQIYAYVCHPTEAFMDIEQSKTMSYLLTEQTNLLIKDQYRITPTDYINALCNEFGISELQNNENINQCDQLIKIDWASIGNRNAKWFLTVPPILFMNGLIQNNCVPTVQNAKPKATRRKSNKYVSDAAVVKPKKVVKQNKSYKTETKSRVRKLEKILRRKCAVQDGVNPFEFLINPNSYSETIENIFDLSFIIKEGHGQISMHPHLQQPVLAFVPSSERQRRKDLNKRNRKQISNGQCILKFNPSSYFDLIDVYDIKESQIERENQSDDSESDSEESGEESEESSDEQSEEEHTLHRTHKKRTVYNRDKEEAD